MGRTAGEGITFILGKLQDPELTSLWNKTRDSLPGQTEEQTEE